MKSQSIKLMVLGLGACALLRPDVAHAYGVLQRLNTNGTPDTNFGPIGNGGRVFTTGHGDNFSTVYASTSIVLAAGTLDNGNGTTSPVIRRYNRMNGSPDNTWNGNGWVVVPAPTLNPLKHVQTVVRDSQTRYIALCDDGTKVWLVRFDNNGHVDLTFGDPNTGVSEPFGLGQSLRAIGMKILNDDRLIVIAENPNGAAGFSLARVDTLGHTGLFSVGSSFGESATVAHAYDLAIDSSGTIAIVGVSATNNFGLITLTNDPIVPEKLVVNYRDTVHYSQYPQNATYGSGVAFDTVYGGMVVAVGIAASPQHPIAGVRIPMRRYNKGYDAAAWEPDVAYNATYWAGTTPQTVPATWKVIVVNDQLVGFPPGWLGVGYLVAGTSVTAAGVQQLEIVKLDNSGTVEGDTTFGTNGAVHIPISGYNVAGLALTFANADKKPLIGGVAY